MRLKGRKSTESNGDQRLRVWAQRINDKEAKKDLQFLVRRDVAKTTRI